jgi:hypothetical protein
MSDAAGLAGTTSPETGGRVRSCLVSGWRFARHLLEMVVAMLAGMALPGVAIGALGEPPGYNETREGRIFLGGSPMRRSASRGYSVCRTSKW